MRMKPLESAYEGSFVPLNHWGPVPPQPWSCAPISLAVQGSKCPGECNPYRYDNGRLGGELVRYIDVHLNLGRVVAKVADLLQRGAEARRRRGGKPKESLGEHVDNR